MRCTDFDDAISLYIDDVLTNEEKQNFEAHLQQCEACKETYESFKILIDTVGEVQEVELPDDFQLQLGERLRQEKTRKNRRNINWRMIGSIAAACMILIASATMLPNLSKDGLDVAPMEPMTMETADTPNLQTTSKNDVGLARDGRSVIETPKLLDETVEGMENFASDYAPDEAAVVDRKIIRRGRLSLEVEDFDGVHGRTLEIVEAHGGYVEHAEVYYNYLDRENPKESLRSASMQLRIPQDDFLNIFQEIKALGIVVGENVSGEDITETYMDVENQLENLKLQEERLREILNQADEVDDLLKIENELNRIRTEINRLTARLQTFDKLVAMSTLDLHIQQIRDEGIHIQSLNQGLWDRAKNNFVISINNMVRGFERTFISFFTLLPWLVLTFLIGGPMGYYIYKKGWFKR